MHFLAWKSSIFDKNFTGTRGGWALNSIHKYSGICGIPEWFAKFNSYMYGYNSFRYLGSKLWNSLPSHKMRPPNLREIYPQITYVSHRSILDSCLVFKRMQNHHCIVWHNIQYTKWFYHLLITYMNECSAPLAQCDPAAWPPVYIYMGDILSDICIDCLPEKWHAKLYEEIICEDSSMV